MSEPEATVLVDKADDTRSEGLMTSIPADLPALAEALEVSTRAVSYGFEWDTVEDVWAQAEGEIQELREAYALAPKDECGRVLPDTPEATEAQLELGDVLFSVANVGRKMGLVAEEALHATNAKFCRRWAFMEGAAWAQGISLETLSFDELQELWDQAKAVEKAQVR